MVPGSWGREGAYIAVFVKSTENKSFRRIICLRNIDSQDINMDISMHVSHIHSDCMVWPLAIRSSAFGDEGCWITSPLAEITGPGAARGWVPELVSEIIRTLFLPDGAKGCMMVLRRECGNWGVTPYCPTALSTLRHLWSTYVHCRHHCVKS
jgi:hypothetical protein